MDARILRCSIIAAALLSVAAGYRTQNFVVSAKTPQLAAEIAQAAERYRRELALEWLGRELPAWGQPCPIWVTEFPHVRGGEGAGGATSFTFINGQPQHWRMNIQGGRARLLDSVLPHEVLHTVFATHFGQPLPRWADEGACTTVEHDSEKQKHNRMLYEFLGANRGIPFNQMFVMSEYPDDILPLYSQGFSLARFLIEQGGKRKYVQFVGEGLRTRNWNQAVRGHYGFEHLSDLQLTWNRWVVVGQPAVAPRSPIESNDGQVQLASAASPNSGMVQPASTFNAPAAATPQSTSLSPDGWYIRQAEAARMRREGAEQAVTRPQPPQDVQPYVLEASRGGYAPGSVGRR